MTTTRVRPDLSEKNQYWISRHRYYELKHFCLQYDNWKKEMVALEGINKPELFHADKRSIYRHGDPTATAVEKREFYRTRIEMIDREAKRTDLELSDYILKGVTKGYSYDTLLAKFEIPCCRSTYYERYRRFFWLLDQAQKSHMLL